MGHAKICNPDEMTEPVTIGTIITAPSHEQAHNE